MATRMVEVTEERAKFIDEQVKSGRYADANAVVEDSLRLLDELEREEQEKIEWLREAIQEGIDDIENGRYTSFSSREELNDFLDGIWAEARADVGAEAKRA